MPQIYSFPFLNRRQTARARSRCGKIGAKHQVSGRFGGFELLCQIKGIALAGLRSRYSSIFYRSQCCQVWHTHKKIYIYVFTYIIYYIFQGEIWLFTPFSNLLIMLNRKSMKKFVKSFVRKNATYLIICTWTV